MVYEEQYSSVNAIPSRTKCIRCCSCSRIKSIPALHTARVHSFSSSSLPKVSKVLLKDTVVYLVKLRLQKARKLSRCVRVEHGTEEVVGDGRGLRKHLEY